MPALSLLPNALKASSKRLGCLAACLVALLLAPSVAVLAAEGVKPAAGAPAAIPGSIPGVPGTVGSGAPPPAASPPVPEPKPIPVPNLSAAAEAADASLRALEDGLAVPAAMSAITTDLPAFSRDFDAAVRSSRTARAGRAERGRINDIEGDWQSLQDRLGAWDRTLTRRAEELEARLAKLADMRKTWHVTDQLAQDGAVPKPVGERTAAVLGRIDRVRGQIEDAREGVLSLQEQLSRFQARAADQRELLKQAMAQAVGSLLTRDAAPLWGSQPPATSPSTSPPASVPAGTPASQAIANNISATASATAEYAGANRMRIALLPMILVLLLTGLWVARWQIRRRLEDEPDLKAASWLFERPLAVALLVTAMSTPWVLMYAPGEVNLLVLAVALLPTILILQRVVDPRLAPFLHALLVLYVLSRLLEVLDAVPSIERPLFQLQMLATIGGLIWLLRSRYVARREAGEAAPRSVSWTVRGILAATAGFTVAVAADLMGYTQLGRFLANATLGAIYTAVILYAGALVMYGLITLALNLWPLQNLGMVRNFKDKLERRARRVTRWLAIGLWLLATLDLLALQEPVTDGLRRMMVAPIKVGEISLSFGGILIFIGTIWAAVLVSRLSRFVLDEELFTRLSLPRGIPYALTTILHYVLLVGGVMLAIASTGINLDRFTIIAGAISVGAGFGLQGIVNNFVSGLILLFERPVKVGDSVAMANHDGLIQSIGIRACVMRTGEGAEIIVPNSMLISREVTNWTLTDRQRRIEIPLGIAYGNDPEHIMQLLTGIAADHPDILAFPPPDAQFSGFGVSALEFKLGAWTARFEHAGSIRSELCVAIYKALKRENIEIPYPQASLHLRSIDRGVLDGIREQPGRRAPERSKPEQRKSEHRKADHGAPGPVVPEHGVAVREPQAPVHANVKRTDWHE